MRPAELSADTSPHIDAVPFFILLYGCRKEPPAPPGAQVRHALETLAAEDPPYRPKWVALLQAWHQHQSNLWNYWPCW